MFSLDIISIHLVTTYQAITGDSSLVGKVYTIDGK